MRCTSFKIQLAGEGVTSNDDFDHVYSWGTDVPRVQVRFSFLSAKFLYCTDQFKQILTDIYTHLELKLEVSVDIGENLLELVSTVQKLGREK